MNRLASRRNFSASFFFKITQTERVANDLSLFFAKKKKEEEEEEEEMRHRKKGLIVRL